MTAQDSSSATPRLEPTLPSSWYRSERVFALEKEHIFCREWVCAAREEDLPHSGSYRVVDVLGESIIVVRNRDGRVRAFYNVCRHRGARLCRSNVGALASERLVLNGGVIAGRIMCPYHQWTYDLDGHLIAAPHLMGHTAFDKEAFSLYAVGVECWGGFIFLNLTPAAAMPLQHQISGIPERIARYPLTDLRIGRTIEYSVAANWKVICENYNECYHCAGIHPELCAVVPSFKDRGGAGLDWLRGVPHRPGAYTFTDSGTTRRRAFRTLNEDEQVRHKGELLYPNLFLSLACDHAAVFILRPRDAGRTDITCHFLFEPFEIEKPDFDPSDVSEFWDLVNRQDWAICETVQEGIGARVHEHGFYAPMEDFNLDIRRYVQERIPLTSQHEG
jgi:Rieske 2Fe-2S family protein